MRTRDVSDAAVRGMAKRRGWRRCVLCERCCDASVSAVCNRPVACTTEGGMDDRQNARRREIVSEALLYPKKKITILDVILETA